MERALFRQVNHVALLARDAEGLFRLFGDALALPIAWPFEDFGSFASGGVSVGDCAIEVVRGPAALTHALVWGVALEPVDGPGLVAALNGREWQHGEPMSTSAPDGASMWTNVRLNHPDPRTPAVFSCDYHFIDVPVELAKGRAELNARGGGPLGVGGCARLELSPTARKLDVGQWARLLSPLPVNGGTCHFASGPDISLVDGDAEKLVLRVRSLELAMKALPGLGIAGERTADGIALTGAPLQGLALSLTES